MEQLMQEIRDYAARRGVLPSTVVQRGGKQGGTVWARWEAGASCSHRVSERIRKWMDDNPITS